MKLSPRERQVVYLVGRRGLSYKAAARELEIASSTVRGYAHAVADRIRGDGQPRWKLAWLAATDPNICGIEPDGAPAKLLI